MDTAVALVQTYLQINGYFTVVEYPIVEMYARRPAQMVTDLDILAFRFPGADLAIAGEIHERDRFQDFRPDPMLRCPTDVPDMIVGEVKEGRATFNRAAHDPEVLTLALSRFGCCHSHHVSQVVQNLLRKGEARTHSGHVVRLVAFGSSSEERDTPWGHIVPLHHVIQFLQDYLETHSEALRCMHLKDSTLSLMALLQKTRAHGT